MRESRRAAAATALAVRAGWQKAEQLDAVQETIVVSLGKPCNSHSSCQVLGAGCALPMYVKAWDHGQIWGILAKKSDRARGDGVPRAEVAMQLSAR